LTVVFSYIAVTYELLLCVRTVCVLHILVHACLCVQKADEELAECTFHPSVNQEKRRKAAAQLRKKADKAAAAAAAAAAAPGEHKGSMGSGRGHDIATRCEHLYADSQVRKQFVVFRLQLAFGLNSTLYQF
jgi:hypothetical protein